MNLTYLSDMSRMKPQDDGHVHAKLSAMKSKFVVQRQTYTEPVEVRTTFPFDEAPLRGSKLKRKRSQFVMTMKNVVAVEEEVAMSGRK
jgi:hypothetical protein